MTIDIRHTNSAITFQKSQLELIQQRIAVMEAALQGAEIEYSDNGVTWHAASPQWNWNNKYYRVKPVKDSIDWTHVSAAFNYMARDKDGVVELYKTKPIRDNTCWFVEDGSMTLEASHFASLHQGTIFWEDSLQTRKV